MLPLLPDRVQLHEGFPDLNILTNRVRLRFTNGLQDVADALNANIMRGAIKRYNSEFGPHYLGRLDSEPLPQDARQLSSFRARLGHLIEYALSVTIDRILREDEEEIYLTFVVNNQYPDFYLRMGNGDIALRVDCKTLHDESAEYSARFDLPTKQINPSNDLILYVAWQWQKTALAGHNVTYPHILDGLFIPAIEIGRERDNNLRIRGGAIMPSGEPILQTGNKDSNFGKIHRIVHETRIGAADLTPSIQAFLAFIEKYHDAVARARRAASGRATPSPTSDEIAPPETSDPTT